MRTAAQFCHAAAASLTDQADRYSVRSLGTASPDKHLQPAWQGERGVRHAARLRIMAYHRTLRSRRSAKHNATQHTSFTLHPVREREWS